MSSEEKCPYCSGTVPTLQGEKTGYGRPYEIKPCANGDLKVRAQLVNNGIVLFKDCLIAAGYFDVNYCPICGRKLKEEIHE